jgi:hypothetical protein
MKPLLQRIERGEIDPTRIITHTLAARRGGTRLRDLKNKRDDCENVVLKP